MIIEKLAKRVINHSVEVATSLDPLISSTAFFSYIYYFCRNFAFFKIFFFIKGQVSWVGSFSISLSLSSRQFNDGRISLKLWVSRCIIITIVMDPPSNIPNKDGIIKEDFEWLHQRCSVRVSECQEWVFSSNLNCSCDDTMQLIMI